MDNFTFLLDAPTAVLAGTLSRIQVAKTGKFKDPRYGKFSITAKDFDAWVKNFSREPFNSRLPVDVDHSPEKRGDTEAVGWIVGLDTLGPTGSDAMPDQLWATVEWNTLGRTLIEDKRYQFISPSYAHDFALETGEKIGSALIGVALTNRPFLSMATVSLSKSHVGFAVEDDEPPEPEPDPKPEGAYRGSRMPELTNIAKAFNLAEDANEATILAHIASLDETKVPEGQVLVDATQLASMVANANLGAAAAAELKQSKFDTEFSAALAKCAFVEDQRSLMQSLYDANAESTLKLMADAKPIVNTQPKGRTSDGTGGAAGATHDSLTGYEIDAEEAELDSKARQLMAQDANLTYGAAFDRVTMGA